tara:strand:- start:5367 stop:6146 length:780 start_codon:yes stop_codon:yes gene_type:complete
MAVQDGLLGSNANIPDFLQSFVTNRGATFPSLQSNINPVVPAMETHIPRVYKGAVGLFDQLGTDGDSQASEPPSSSKPTTATEALANYELTKNPFLNAIATVIPGGSIALGLARGGAFRDAIDLLDLTDPKGNRVSPTWAQTALAATGLGGLFGKDPLDVAMARSLDPFGSKENPFGPSMDALMAETDVANPYGPYSHADDPFGGMGDPNAPTDLSMAMDQEAYDAQFAEGIGDEEGDDGSSSNPGAGATAGDDGGYDY